MTFLLKKLLPNELGNGESARGPHLLIHKKTKSFFPSLGRTKENDYIYLQVNGVSLKYTYYNSKYSKPDQGGNDAYRLTINNSIRSTSSPFSAGDIVLLQHTAPNTYKLHYFSTTDPYYNVAQSLLDAQPKTTCKLISSTFLKSLGITSSGPSTSGGSPTPVNGGTKPPPRKKTVPSKDLDELLGKNVVEDEVKRKLGSRRSTSIERDTDFRKVILYLYNYKCAISEESSTFYYEGFCNLEAAHIIPKENGGGDHPSNGIAMTRDLHWAFDKGFFTIDPEDYSIVVHPEILRTSSPLNEYHGQYILFPERNEVLPDREALQWRMEHIFGENFN
ncbi:hypothetical protein GH741_02705 [Aquibacillus halophilus]|uniref:HNH nuclease domain-containing protein n=1 Tax=Aquibacillus halophilus TaxID=930132 RepID=A0A6A8DJZ8_9BACI|nr:HNH endonuclease [Aquibacillus halophilus]MRH41582.1 hypothetical protein [Aquibacillus halophilus]